MKYFSEGNEIRRFCLDFYLIASTNIYAQARPTARPQKKPATKIKPMSLIANREHGHVQVGDESWRAGGETSSEERRRGRARDVRKTYS